MPTNPLAGSQVKITDAFDDRVFTPAWTNLTIGSGALNEGRWKQIGNLVLYSFRLQLGTSPAFVASTPVVMDLPLTAWAGGGSSIGGCMGTWSFRDSSTSPLQHYAGAIVGWDPAGTQISFGGAWTGTTFTRVGGSTPVVPAAADVLSGAGQFWLT